MHRAVVNEWSARVRRGAQALARVSVGGPQVRNAADVNKHAGGRVANVRVVGVRAARAVAAVAVLRGPVNNRFYRAKGYVGERRDLARCR